MRSKRPTLSFSQLIVQQGKGGKTTRRFVGNYGGFPAYTLYAPPLKIVKPAKPEVKPTRDFVVPVPTWTARGNHQPVPIILASSMLTLPDANKLSVVGDGIDEVLWADLPVPSHWKVTYQLIYGGNNEYDHEYDTASLTFPPGRFYIIVSADGYDPRLYVIDATEPVVEPEEE